MQAPSDSRLVSASQPLWRRIAVPILLVSGVCLSLIGLYDTLVVLYAAGRNIQSGLTRIDPTANEWTGLLWVSYGLIMVSGLLLCAAALQLRAGRGRWAAMLVLAAGAAFAACVWAFPGPVPL